MRRRHASEMSNPEFALFMEKEHLRGAEEDDYIIMENLIQRRYVQASVEGYMFITLLLHFINYVCLSSSLHLQWEWFKLLG